jgi:hypothetical protein
VRRLSSAHLLAAGGLIILGSLYLPWQQAPAPSNQNHILGLLNLGSTSLDGWSSGIGDAVALVALLLVGLSTASLSGRRGADRLPLGRCASLAGFLALAVADVTRSVAHERGLSPQGAHFHFAYGAYLGVAAGAVVVVAAVSLRRREIVGYRYAARLPAVVIAAGLLVSLLLPWERLPSSVNVTYPGIFLTAGVIVAALAASAPFAWRTAAAGAERLAVAATTALFTGAALSSSDFVFGTKAYGTKVAIGAAILLVALALPDIGVAWGTIRPSRYALGICVGGASLVASLFLPWQQSCVAKGSGLGPYSGRCLSSNGWTLVGSTTAILVIAVIGASLAARRFPGVPIAELAAGVGLLVATLGFDLIDNSAGGVNYSFAYGSTIGFAGAALIVGLAAAPLRLPSIEWRRAMVRSGPIAASATYLVIAVLPWWDVLPRQLESDLRIAPLSWLTITGVLLGIHLLYVWAGRIGGITRSSESLVILPLALLGLAAVDLIRLRDNGMTWGGGIVVGLCALLTLFGWIEQQARLENFQLPEILRVDRL